MYGVALFLPGVTAAGTKMIWPLVLRTTERASAASMSVLNRAASANNSAASVPFVPQLSDGKSCMIEPSSTIPRQCCIETEK